MSQLFRSRLPLLQSLPRLLHRPSTTTLLSRRFLQTPAPTSSKPPPDYAFAFDIDGVLMHGSTPISTATTALQLLSENSIEFILLTNGGGKSESARTAELSSYLSVPIHPSQFIQSHTPFAAFAEHPEFETVLVIGGDGDQCRHVAKEYGFRNVVIPADILAAYPPISPFTTDKAPAYAQPLPSENTKIDAVLVFNDPRDWALDLQVLVDLTLSDEGRLGTRRPKNCAKPHIPIYFSNPDLIWANEYHLSRLGQGAFRAAFHGIISSLRAAQKTERMEKAHKSEGVPVLGLTAEGKPYEEGLPIMRATVMGKPNRGTYLYAEEVLCEWRKKQLELAGLDQSHANVKTVYMVGDNPASDIRGANNFKSDKKISWVSVLVKTGVYKGGNRTGEAKVVVEDVLAAVKWVIERETLKKQRSTVVWKKLDKETPPEVEGKTAVEAPDLGGI